MAINLVPWREAIWARQRSLRQFYFILMLVLAASSFSIWRYILKSQNVRLEQKVFENERNLNFSKQAEEKRFFLKKITNRNKKLLKLMKMIPHILPNEAKLTEFTLKNNEVYLYGIALNKNRAMQFYSMLKEKIKPSNCTVKEFGFNSKEKHYQFEFNLALD